MYTTVSHSVTFDMPRAQAWERLRDLTLAHRYVPGLTKTELHAGPREGVGASRRVYQGERRWLDETGKKVAIADPGFSDPLQLFVDLVKDKSVPQGVTETAFNQSGTLFFQEKAAMWASLSYAGAFFQGMNIREDFPVGITLFPTQPKATGAFKPAATIMTPTAALSILTERTSFVPDISIVTMPPPEPASMRMAASSACILSCMA